jgi:hypothetical protein
MEESYSNAGDPLCCPWAKMHQKSCCYWGIFLQQRDVQDDGIFMHERRIQGNCEKMFFITENGLE